MYPLLEIQNRDKGRLPFGRIYLGFGNDLRYWSPVLAICSLLQLAPPFSVMARFVGELQNPGTPVVFQMPYRLTTDFFPECHHRCHRNLCKSRWPGDRCCECIYISSSGGMTLYPGLPWQSSWALCNFRVLQCLHFLTSWFPMMCDVLSSSRARLFNPLTHPKYRRQVLVSLVTSP